MPTINERLAALEAAILTLRSGTVTTIITSPSGDVEELVGMDVQQNARLANAEQQTAATAATLAAYQVTTNATLATLVAGLAAAILRIEALEQATNFPVYAFPDMATATGAASGATSVPSIPGTLVYPPAAAATGAALVASVTTGGTEGVSTTETLPFRLAT